MHSIAQATRAGAIKALDIVNSTLTMAESPRSRSRSRELQDRNGERSLSDDDSNDTTDDNTFERKQHEGFKTRHVEPLKKLLYKWKTLMMKKGKRFDTTRVDYSAPSWWADYAKEALRAMARLVKVNEEPITDAQKDTPIWDREFNSNYFDFLADSIRECDFVYAFECLIKFSTGFKPMEFVTMDSIN